MKKTSKIINFFLKFLFLFLFSLFSAGVFCIFILPKIIENQKYADSSFIQSFKKEVRIYPTQNVYISEEKAISDFAQKYPKVIFGIVRFSGTKKEVFPGLILTSDGFCVVLSECLGANSKIIYQGQEIPFELIKKDPKKNLVLIKLDKKNLPTVSFFDLEKIKLGQKIFLISLDFDRRGEIKEIIEEGIISSFDYNPFVIETNIFPSQNLKGAPVFSVDGKLVGLSFIEKNQLKIIPISTIKDFSGF